MAVIFAGLSSCGGKRAGSDAGGDWIVDRFADIKVLRYKVDAFDTLPLDRKLYLYYLSQAALCGRDIIYDQNCRMNLPVRRTLEAVWESHHEQMARLMAKDMKDSAKAHASEEAKAREKWDMQWLEFEKYLKRVWFANGIHHHYSNDKFVPGFTPAYFDALIATTPSSLLPSDFGTRRQLVGEVRKTIFDPNVFPVKVNQKEGVDMVTSSAVNFYEGVTQREVEAFYTAMVDRKDTTPISYGLNSKLMRFDGRIAEKTWKIGGMYSSAIDRVIYWLGKAAEVGDTHQQAIISTLVSYYRTGDLRTFDRYNILWVKDTTSQIDFVNGFIETYSDPLGYKATWESLVNILDPEATRRTALVSAAAQWFEDNSPIDPKYRKEQVKGIFAKVVNAAMLGGDCYPATPIGINLPNADWIRKEHGSKSVTIENITFAYDQAALGNGFDEEFIMRPEDRRRKKLYGTLANNLHTDLHECLGHGSGRMAAGKKGDELKNYYAVIEEARADLFALYFLADPKLIELGVVTTPEVAKAGYSAFILNGLMTQLARIQPGKDIEEAHMRNRQLISRWVYERGKADNVIEMVVRDGKTYVVVNDFDRLRALFGELLREVQRIKSEGDYQAARDLVETYGVKVDQALHKEVLARYSKLNIEPYAGFINPVYKPVMEGGKIVDILIEYPSDYSAQMMEYSKNYSFLPSKN